MRGDRGRFFPPKYETRRIDRDIELHQRAFGTTLDWYFYDPYNSHYDSVYDEGDDTAVTGGRRWKTPVPIPVLSANRREGFKVISDDGMYTLDTLDVRMSYEQARRVGLLPAMDQTTEVHLKDRFVYDNRVFGIRDISVTGQFEPSGHDVMVRIAAVQLRPDELVNDVDFQRWSLPIVQLQRDLLVTAGEEFTVTFHWQDSHGVGVPLGDTYTATLRIYDDEDVDVLVLTSEPGEGITFALIADIDVVITALQTTALTSQVGETLYYELVLLEVDDPSPSPIQLSTGQVVVELP